MHRNAVLLASLVAAALAVVPGCGSGDGSSGAPAAGSAKPAAASSAQPAAPAAAAEKKNEEAPKFELVDKDLSPAGDSWKGWTAKGPAEAEVMEDLGGARIVTKKVIGPGAFDIAFKQGKRNLKESKEALQKGADAARSTVTFTVDTADALEWTTTTGNVKSYDFILLQKSGGKDVTCYTVSPREDEAEIAPLKEACKSLTKK